MFILLLPQAANTYPMDRQMSFAECQLKESLQTELFCSIPVLLSITVTTNIPSLLGAASAPLNAVFSSIARSNLHIFSAEIGYCYKGMLIMCFSKYHGFDVQNNYTQWSLLVVWIPVRFCFAVARNQHIFCSLENWIYLTATKYS